jgi:hypothetical protein
LKDLYGITDSFSVPFPLPCKADLTSKAYLVSSRPVILSRLHVILSRLHVILSRLHVILSRLHVILSVAKDPL